MGTIRNTSQADITVSAEAGAFVFPAGKTKGDFAPERIAEIEAAGAVYFTAGELVTVASDEAPARAEAEPAEEVKADEAPARALKKK